MDYVFDAETEKKSIIKKLREWFIVNGQDCNAVIGISGGKDSTVVAALCVQALGRERVIGVLMPNGHQRDINDSFKVCQELGIKNYTINICNSYCGIIDEMNHNKNGISVSVQTETNLAPRLRMATLYAVAQSVNGRVINTSNYSEYMMGYFTKFGDECGDYKPLIEYTKTEVCQIGKCLPVSKELIDKVPSDGLTNKTDEDNFGFTYDELDRFLRTGKCDDQDIINKILNRIKSTQFKRRT